jgi:cytoplasmic tRNA 2-thiolation protein 1
MEKTLQQNEVAEEEGAETEIKLPVKKQMTVPLRVKKPKGPTPPAGSKQTLGKCERCGYMSSQAICKACMLLEGLNKNRPKTAITVDG